MAQNGPKGFLVVLPREIIEIPQDDDKSWLTAPYSEERREAARKFAREHNSAGMLKGVRSEEL